MEKYNGKILNVMVCNISFRYNFGIMLAHLKV